MKNKIVEAGEKVLAQFRNEKMDQVIEDAQIAFWEVVAKKYPEVKSGDFPPDASFAFDGACKKALEFWLEWNCSDNCN